MTRREEQAKLGLEAIGIKLQENIKHSKICTIKDMGGNSYNFSIQWTDGSVDDYKVWLSFGSMLDVVGKVLHKSRELGIIWRSRA